MSEPSALVVDDHSQVRVLLERLLTTEGYSVLAAARGKEALHLLAERNFSILVTDLRIPSMSGLELVRNARARGWRGPVLITSATLDDVSGGKLHDLGNVGLLRKPFDIKEFRVALLDLAATGSRSPSL